MKYKTSFFNKHIILEDLKRYGGLAVLYFLAIFFIGPMKIMIRLNDTINNNEYFIGNFLNIRHMELQVVFAILFPIVLSVLVFRYLHQNKSVTVMHSFPITRRQLFHSHSISGTLLIALPILLNGIILISLMLMHNDGSELFEEIFTLINILIWMGKLALINISIYLVSSITAIITGISLIHGILSLIFIFLPAGLGGLVTLNFEQLIYGFVPNKNLMDLIMIKILPVTTIISNESITNGLVLWYIVLGVILYITTCFLYQNRELESASDPIAFDILKPVFKYGVTFSSMVLGGAYFHSVQRQEIWLYVGYIIGGYLGYLIAEMLIEKSIWVFKNIKGFVIYSVVIAIIFTGINFDITGYERRIPDIDNVDNVYYGYSIYNYWNEEGKRLKERNNIENVQKLHEEIINNKELFANVEQNMRYRHIGIAYELKNGKTIAREYTVPMEFVENNANVANIYESKEYKINHYSIFDMDESKIEYVEMYSHDVPIQDKKMKLIDKDEISEMIEAIKLDILDESYEEYVNDIRPWASIRFELKLDEDLTNLDDKEEYMRRREKTISVSWKKSYTHLSKWLKEKGYYEKIRVMPKEIDYVVVEEIDEENHFEEMMHKTIDIEELRSSKNRIEIRDKEKIEQLLQTYENKSPQNKNYILGFYLTNGNDFLGWISEENAPDFIKNHFK